MFGANGSCGSGRTGCGDSDWVLVLLEAQELGKAPECAPSVQGLEPDMALFLVGGRECAQGKAQECALSVQGPELALEQDMALFLVEARECAPGRAPSLVGTPLLDMALGCTGADGALEAGNHRGVHRREFWGEHKWFIC